MYQLLVACAISSLLLGTPVHANDLCDGWSERNAGALDVQMRECAPDRRDAAGRGLFKVEIKNDRQRTIAVKIVAIDQDGKRMSWDNLLRPGRTIDRAVFARDVTWQVEARFEFE